MSRLLAAACTWLALAGVWAGPAVAQSDFLRHFMGGQGCTVGPEAKMAPHLPNAGMYTALRTYAETALAEGRAERQGDWIVLGPEICTIRPPIIVTAYPFSAPIVLATVDPFHANEEFGEYGCFVNSEKMQQRMVAQDGLSEDAATQAYLVALADGLLRGQVTFFSDDPLVTPLAFQSLMGDCADLPKIEAIRRSQALLLMHFDRVVRENAQRMRCEENVNPVGIEVAQTLSEASGGEVVNAWVMLEVMTLAIGAGWVEDIGARQRGTPRPPICSYE